MELMVEDIMEFSAKLELQVLNMISLLIIKGYVEFFSTFMSILILSVDTGGEHQVEGQLQAVREPREHLLHGGRLQDGDGLLVRENRGGGHLR